MQDARHFYVQWIWLFIIWIAQIEFVLTVVDYIGVMKDYQDQVI